MVDEKTNVTSIITNRSKIEEHIIRYNEIHLKKSQNSKVCNEKIHKEMDWETIRNRILRGEIKLDDCDDGNVHEFLKLVAKKSKKQMKMWFSNQHSMKNGIKW